MGIIITLIIGGIAGWLAGLIVKGAGFGVIINVVLGIVGALLANWALPQLGIHFGAGLIPGIINATIGAVVILIILSLIRRR
ncbi:MAG: GlsB/YeaQ/YmgE family stress response membrane protein [Alphaproteobacteria bacterium]|nr:GlsB/YeaQ/YmgE family stress response membrane protein [Alphaproteobacteria bacterium]